MKKIEFLEKARDTHGYKYKYLNLSDKITLRDKINIEYDGEFYEQTVSKHLMGRCPEKSIAKKTTTDFIKESKLIWGDKYDYSITEYTGALNTIKIIYDGVVYEQRASSHLLGLAPEFRSNEESLLRDKVNQSDKEGIKEIKEFLDKYKIEYKMNKNLALFDFDGTITTKDSLSDFFKFVEPNPIKFFYYKYLFNIKDKVRILPVSIGWNQNYSLKKGIKVLPIHWETILSESKGSGSYLLLMKIESEKKIKIRSIKKCHYLRIKFFI